MKIKCENISALIIFFAAAICIMISPINQTISNFCLCITGFAIFYALFLTFANKNTKIQEDVSSKEELETIISTLTHDIKTPIIAQIRALDLILNNTFGEFSNEQKEILKEILNSCNLTHKLLQDILVAHKIKNEKENFVIQEFDFIKLTEECCENISWDLSSKNLKLEFQPQDKNIKMFGIKTQIKRAINAILLNCANRCYENAVINVKIQKTPHDVEFCITSKGKEISQKEFEKLLTVDQNTALKYNKIGENLGIYLSNCIIKAHNGKITTNGFKDEINLGFKIPLKNVGLQKISTPHGNI